MNPTKKHCCFQPVLSETHTANICIVNNVKQQNSNQHPTEKHNGEYDKIYNMLKADIIWKNPRIPLSLTIKLGVVWANVILKHA